MYLRLGALAVVVLLVGGCVRWRQPAAAHRLGRAGWGNGVRFLLPYVRIELLIRTMLTRRWDPDHSPIVKREFKRALELRSRVARSGWFN